MGNFWLTNAVCGIDRTMIHQAKYQKDLLLIFLVSRQYLWRCVMTSSLSKTLILSSRSHFPKKNPAFLKYLRIVLTEIFGKFSLFCISDRISAAVVIRSLFEELVNFVPNSWYIKVIQFCLFTSICFNFVFLGAKSFLYNFKYRFPWSVNCTSCLPNGVPKCIW